MAACLSFIYADLIVLPLLDTYRRYFGLRMAVYLFVVLFSTMVLAGIVVDIGFSLAHVTPAPNPNVRGEITRFALNYTFWLNLVLGAWAAWLFWLNHRDPMDHSMHHGAGQRGSRRRLSRALVFWKTPTTGTRPQRLPSHQPLELVKAARYAVRQNITRDPTSTVGPGTGHEARPNLRHDGLVHQSPGAARSVEPGVEA